MSQNPMDPAILEQLLGNVVYQRHLSYYEGLDVFRLWLREGNLEVLAFLQDSWERLTDEQRPAIAFALAEYYRTVGDVALLRALYASDDPRTRDYVLNALWSEPGENPEMGPCIVDLALQGAADPDPKVRTQACSVFQNQAGWGVDVSRAVEPLHGLLQDPDPNVRRQAACAVGNLAKKRYALAGTLPLLTDNLAHPERQVREHAAWALWQLSRCKHDIGEAVAALARLPEEEDIGNLHKNAVGALLHHAAKSPENRALVEQTVRAAGFVPHSKPATRLLATLAL